MSMHDGNMWYKDVNGDICERFDISDTGYGILDGYGTDVYCVDDAVSKFLETLDWIDRKIEEIYESLSITGSNSMEHPIDMDYSRTFNNLGLDLGFYLDLKDTISNDLYSITGRQVPW